MMNKSIIFFDIDGTILTSSYSVPASASAAISKARQNGHICIINTGRPYSHIEPIVKEIGFDGYICSCGQHILLDGETKFYTAPSPDLCREVVRRVRSCQLDVIFEANAGIWFDYSRPFRCEIQETLSHFSYRGFCVDENIDEKNFCFEKFCVFTNPNSNFSDFCSWVSSYFSIIDRGNDLYELVLRGCSKETGIQFVANYFEISTGDCLAIGDSTNDLPMFRSVGHSIAMGNAPASVKEAAEYVTRPITQDGLAYALQHYGLE